MNIAIIPARGGSKRIPRKNIKEFHGKPMIAYSIEAALDSECFDKVIVSTDDKEIAEVAIQYGAEVPFMRPANIADDYATTLDVIKHAVEYTEQQGWGVKSVCCIYATAPFLIPEFIQRGLIELTSSNIDYAFSATSFPFPIQRALKLNHEQRVEMFQPEYLNTRSQDLEEAYHDAGQFYWGTVEAFIEKKTIFGSNSKSILLPRKRVQDIDTPEDWDLAEALYRVIEC
ncbi:pseudaminic acid cytidylyltransferase [Pseudoalteromonas carrageenovora]|uniref:pseudaminic acid cytidylyltransferase n=1 Tax=Pseudoalteromonas carrageenovora TaxID=227 RepID=UPI0026E36EE6|nr:pseudaminic acid cytidylyltransferase [Pseudoalteromonas carrageenovora]MDO6463678.1 pseudaminic acid cytidylyltransferase [Pseudoalteromonas carrageenovora]